MFPKAVENLIEAYALDMGLFEELQKLKFKKNIIRTGDEDLFVETMMLLSHNGRVDTTDMLRILPVLYKDFWKTTAGWLYCKLHELYERRCKIWEDVGLFQTHFCDFFLDKFEENSQLLRMWTKHRSEIYRQQEQSDDYLIGP